MWVQYRIAINEPTFLRGAIGEIRELEPHWAEQLIREGHAFEVDPPKLPEAPVEQEEEFDEEDTDVDSE